MGERGPLLKNNVNWEEKGGGTKKNQGSNLLFDLSTF